MLFRDYIKCNFQAEVGLLFGEICLSVSVGLRIGVKWNFQISFGLRINENYFDVFGSHYESGEYLF